MNPLPQKPEFRKINRLPKVGDYIRIVTPVYEFDAPGDVLKIHQVTTAGVRVLISDHPKLQEWMKANSITHYKEYWRYTRIIHDFEYVEKV